MVKNHFAETIPDFLKTKRISLGDTQVKVGKRIGVTHAMINQIERGVRRFKPIKVGKISQAYQLNEEEKKHLEQLVATNKWWVTAPQRNPTDDGNSVVVPPVLQVFYQITKLRKEERDELMQLVHVWIAAHEEK